jgi:pyridoxal/pyridoxine/pyridoxamine kinase
MTSAVLGDSGVLYVSPKVVSVYKTMLQLATIITPNWFEVECVLDDLPSRCVRLTPSSQDLD